MEPFVNIVRVKIIDGRGRTLCYLQKQTYYDANGEVDYSESWSAPSKPIKDRPPGVPFDAALVPRAAVRRSRHGLVLELPGLSLRLNKLQPMLDRFAAAHGLVDHTGAAITCNLDSRSSEPTLKLSELRGVSHLPDNDFKR